MSDIKLWAFSLCCAAGASALFSLLSPDGAMGKLARMVMGVFVLLCIISPLGLAGSLEVEGLKTAKAPDVSDAAKQLGDEMAIMQVQNRINELICDKLATLGIIPQDVRIDINVSDGELDILGAEVVLPKQYTQSADTAAQSLSEYLGFTVAVEIKEEQ